MVRGYYSVPGHRLFSLWLLGQLATACLVTSSMSAALLSRALPCTQALPCLVSSIMHVLHGPIFILLSTVFWAQQGVLSELLQHVAFGILWTLVSQWAAGRKRTVPLLVLTTTHKQ